ncbi:MAG: hypothetical protein O6940_05870 [Ignavibacteria bacterium]|nr:hypothetical protein [Ignavibacteria bacterium]
MHSKESYPDGSEKKYNSELNKMLQTYQDKYDINDKKMAENFCLTPSQFTEFKYTNKIIEIGLLGDSFLDFIKGDLKE